MLARVFALLSLALFVSAGRIEARTPQCNGGTQYCCSGNFFDNGAAYADGKGGLVGAATAIGDLVNSNCGFLNLIGNSCSANQQQVCCSGIGGDEIALVDARCTNLNLNL